MPIHIHPVAELAPRVLLPGDPGAAMAMAQTLLAEDRLMFNHNGGLWGYSGTASDGEPLTIQSTGLGGPSAAIVLEELAELGATTAVQAGTCRPIAAHLSAGDLIAADALLGGDGTSRALGAHTLGALDPALSAALARRADHVGPVASLDLFYDPAADATIETLRDRGAIAVDMQAAALAAVAARHRIVFGCLLIVGRGEPPRQDELDAATTRLGDAAVGALLGNPIPNPKG